MSAPSSPTGTVVALVPTSDSEWQPILHASNQVVLYNPRSHALTISNSSNFASSSIIVTRKPHPCPYCKQPLPAGFESSLIDSPLREEDELEEDLEAEVLNSVHTDPAYHSRASNYFQLLAVSNDTISRPSSPPGVLPAVSPVEPTHDGGSTAFPPGQMAEGYFKRFFQEEYKLGMGANGSVFLCQHVLDGNPLGHFAVKKIAVGESHSYLLKILREVRLLERLHHPNIVIYHHAWLENCQFSAFGPRIPTLHVLMQWAEGGSLDDFIDIRLGRKPAHPHIHPLPAENLGRFETADDEAPYHSAPTPIHSPSPAPENTHSRSARIRAFRKFQRATPEEREQMMREGFGNDEGSEKRKGGAEWTPVHLLSADEVKSLFHDVVEGLGFLHNKSILHLDLKPGNVLLTWDDGRMIPRAMLSDFGTSRDMINSGSIRSGNTGTLEYTSPESLPSPDTGLLQQIDSKSDMWSLGMILHKMLFFKLPYRYASEGDANGEATSLGRNEEGEKMRRLEEEVQHYPGFKATTSLVTTFEARKLPRAYLVLLESLLNRSPSGRPSCERVAVAIREGKLDPLQGQPKPRRGSPDALIPATSLRPRSDAARRERESEDGSASLSTSERAKILGLPPSSEILGPDDQAQGRVGRLWSGWRLRRLSMKRSRTWRQIGKVMKSPTGRISMKFIRSCVLVIKVLTVSRVCPNPETSPRPLLLILLLGAAIADTVVDVEPWHRGLLVSLGLAAVHVNLVRYGAGTLLCCA